ncbi:putative glycolipid-binding domain-containing protein [Myceligenerans sp. TRM 65318]|uniref:Glycolipid-binding domain-containing protein n=2 Tax=Myceligenerans pegani TaxID=2776917 RepID=A0ABR9MXS2_9MICO|nr:putative glycolipid-binding domain-containing protein [Myceligenerans sp. TRM 65318]MBE3018463.1 putative glycolipid-binding domain-containing protein [Myceligenerans sp. TRM 65318]
MPLVSAWTHSGVRAGFEVLFAETVPAGYLLRGHTTAVEGPEAWSVGYRIEADGHWHTRRAEIERMTPTGSARTTLERIDRAGSVQWLVEGVLRRELDGCLDVDLESSAVTNTLPVHRLDAVAGKTYATPAVFVRAGTLAVERLEQEYRLVARTSDEIRFDYASSTFDFRCELSYDTSGLILRYPGIARRTR